MWIPQNYYNMKYSPEIISELKPDEVFVFGSNLDGYHSGGAACTAMIKSLFNNKCCRQGRIA